MASLLAGCSANFAPSAIAPGSDSKTPIGNITGAVHGGNFPVTGSQIYLFATGTGGYKTASTSLITKGAPGVTCNNKYATWNGTAYPALAGACYVTTDANGSFSLGGEYSCTAGQQVYLVALGGNPGLSSGTNNNYIVQMVGMGECPAAGNMAAKVPYLDMDEMTTVAFAYAMAPFAKDEFDIATDNTTAGATAIRIAMANSTNIVDIGRGTVPGATLTGGSIGSTPVSKLTLLADILATCVNTSGTLNSGNANKPVYQPCYSLLNNTVQGFNTFTEGTGLASSGDTAQAMIYLAQNPANNVGSIFNLLPTTPVWTASQLTPSDWTLSIAYKNVVSSHPGNIAFDSNGNAWVSDRNSLAADGSNGGAVVEITPAGVVTRFTNLNNGSANGSIYALAVDPSNVIWALDYTNSQIYRLDETGKWLSTISGNQLNNPNAISFNSNGSALVLNAGNSSISRFSASGVAQTAATYNQSGADGYGSIGTPEAIAVDTNGNAFLAENGGCACVGILANNGTTEVAYDDYSGKVNSASAIAMDSSNHAWQAQANNTIVENATYASGSYQNYDLNFFNKIPTLSGYYFNLTNFFGLPIAASPTTLSNGGLNNPVALAFDGAGNLWAANSGASTVSGFNGTTALASNGFQTGSTGATYGVATDPAGDLWTVNGDGSVSEILGIAAPTVTPVYAGQIGVKP
ncbi:MAG TPA: hypothetical protein VGU25_12430 [Acidobacteriaceae bacterium]|nr:hypothetical protein [Acidobacteriaceae bacterium]